ncbi:amidohydrolase family protein [Rhodococcus sp. ACPA1]|uniref:amidohydrolase family protein n=1 Tax=Rhodococcus sp. ACPA1 TaxID=2028572 RepID=UPI00211BAE2C|nr:amidohydrolase family protein [Rhodococcus sp. ACPA1]
MDDSIGNRADTDILVVDGRIVQIDRGISPDGSEVIDATGCIVIPGFVDTHRHTWESALRGSMPSCTLDDYLATVIGAFGPAYRPEDVYVGNLLGSLEALNAGITTLVDWSHCNNTPDHADEGIRALRESGIRAMYAHGVPAGAEWWFDSQLNHPDDARRVRERYFASDDGLLTFALAVRGPGVSRREVVAHDWALARELEARISVHVGMRITGVHGHAIRELADAGLLGADTTYVHATTNADDELKLVAESGGSVSLAPYVELLMGHGHPPIGRLQDVGVDPSLSIDVVTSVPGDMFTQMRTALAYQRIQDFGDDIDTAFAPALQHRDVLRFATISGAQACGLDSRTGTLSPGKDADIVLVRGDAINTMPVIDPIATVVTSADVSNIDTVLVRGEVRKRHGALVGVDLTRLRNLAESSRDRILHASGIDPQRNSAGH